MDETDITRICRSCMKKISLRAAKKNNNPKTIQMFCHCINVKVSDESKLPQQFCSNCVIKIESSYSFITEAQKVDVTLKNLLSRVETSVIVELENNKFHGRSNDVKTKEENIEIEAGEEFVLRSESTLDCTNTIVDIHEKEQVKIENYSNHYEEDNYSLSGNEMDEQNFFISSETGDEIVNKKMAKKKNVCVICLKKFTSQIWFAKHMAKEHSQKKFSCKYCSKTFTIHSKLKEHLTVHSAERNFSCTECGKRYKHKQQLAVHMRSHGEAKPFVCDLCSKSFKRKGVLIYHMTFHQEKKHLCNICGFSFYSNSNLTTHMRTHTGEKPFQCTSCPKAFNTSSSLRRHERLHRGEAPYACDTCAKPFSGLGSLIRHKRVHTGELPYKCPWCEHAFTDSWKRKVHMMRAHGAGLADIPRLDKAGERLDARGRPPAHCVAPDS